MQRTIYLHEGLQDYYPDPIVVEGESIAEAILALGQFIQTDQPIPMTIQGVDSDTHLFSRSNVPEIHVYPRLAGGGGQNGLGQVLLGVALIGLSFLVPTAGIMGFQALSSAAIFQTGAMIALGGIMAFLQPTPEDSDEEASSYIGATENTVQSGTPITLIFGTRRHGGHFLSFDVDTKKNVVSDGTAGDEVSAGDGIYKVYDVTPLANDIRPIRAVYAGAVAAPGNIPVADWATG